MLEEIHFINQPFISLVLFQLLPVALTTIVQVPFNGYSATAENIKVKKIILGWNVEIFLHACHSISVML